LGIKSRREATDLLAGSLHTSYQNGDRGDFDMGSIDLRLGGEKKVLDVCCGPKGMWFDKHDKRALFLDNRKEFHKMVYPSGTKTANIDPDEIGDFTNIKYPDNTFYIVVMDPPHIVQENPTGMITKQYGHLTKDNWQNVLRKGFAECFRVLKPNGTFIFKWCENNIPLKEILELTPEKPLFGHKSGKHLNTHWLCFIKKESDMFVGLTPKE